MIDKDAFAALRQRICAIGVLRVSVEDYVQDPEDPKFKIFGTGFLIGSLIVMTNRHVISYLHEYLEKESIPKNRRHVAFLRAHGPDIQQSFHELEKIMVIADPHLDVGLISFRATADDPIRTLTPVEVSKTFEYEVGDPVAVYGYAFGENLLKRESGERERVYRFGPILQRGHISAIAPFDHARNIERVLLDVRTARGMSGSPVFDPRTGLVFALHSSGIEDTVAFGIPLSAALVALFVETIVGNSPGDQGTTKFRRVARPPLPT